jgi:putative two-component system response regulator
MDAIYMLAVASESKDEDTGRHVRRIQHYTHAIARELGFDDIAAERIGHSAILHDVGKIHVPDHILKKPGPLTEDERRIVKEHTTAGERILSSRPFFELARKIARSHHENWDGSGYPDNAGGQEIPVEARIVHLADVYDALTTPRVYKRAWTEADAAGVIKESRGIMFDPEVVGAFDSLRTSGDVCAIRQRFDGWNGGGK